MMKTPHPPVPLRADLQQTVISAAKHIRDEYPEDCGHPLIARQAARFFLRALCPPRPPGRPRFPDVTDAIELRRQGKQWKEIRKLRQLNSADLRLLRDRVRSRLSAQRRRKKEGILHAKNYDAKCSPL